MLQPQTLSRSNGLCFLSLVYLSWKEMWLQDYWQSLDQSEALTAMIHHNESHQGKFWDYMHEIFLKRTRQHWPSSQEPSSVLESGRVGAYTWIQDLPWVKKTANFCTFFWLWRPGFIPHTTSAVSPTYGLKASTGLLAHSVSFLSDQKVSSFVPKDCEHRPELWGSAEMSSVVQGMLSPNTKYYFYFACHLILQLRWMFASFSSEWWLISNCYEQVTFPMKGLGKICAWRKGLCLKTF